MEYYIPKELAFTHKGSRFSLLQQHPPKLHCLRSEAGARCLQHRRQEGADQTFLFAVCALFLREKNAIIATGCTVFINGLTRLLRKKILFNRGPSRFQCVRRPRELRAITKFHRGLLAAHFFSLKGCGSTAACFRNDRVRREI